jgi:hypothetical protein
MVQTVLEEEVKREEDPPSITEDDQDDEEFVSCAGASKATIFKIEPTLLPSNVMTLA